MKKQLLFIVLLCSTTITKAQMAPTLVADVCAGCNSNTSNLFIKANKLMFVAQDTNYGRELRSYDGVNAPIVTDIYTGKFSGTLVDTSQQLISYGQNIFFQGTLANGKSQLMKWDGNNPPSKITDINSFGVDYPDAFSAINGKVYFAAWQDTLHGDQMYELDTSSNSVTRITDHVHNMDFFITESITFKGKLYFVTDRGSSMTIFVYNPATGIDTVAFPTFYTYYDPVDLTIIDTMMYFSAIEGSHGRELFQYDGYSDTPKRVTDVSPGNADGVAPSGIIKYQNKVYFFGNDNGIASLYKIWYYDPATQQVNSLSSYDVGLHPNKKKMLVVYKNRLIIQAQNELAYTNGTTVTQISSGGFNPTEALEFQGDLYMNGFTTANERALFKIDTTAFSLSIPSTSLRGSAMLYPNPSKGMAYIKLNLAQKEHIAIILVDITGKVNYSAQHKKYQEGSHTITLPLQKLPPGIYTCTMYDKQNNKLWSEQLAIEP